MSNLSLVVAGEMNIDIIVSGLPNFPKSGGLVNGDKLEFGPGGKSRNIAEMAAFLLPRGSVAMVAKTAEDPYGLWKLPVEALQRKGIHTEYIKVLSARQARQLPGFALILVDKNGNNQIIGAPGITRYLHPEDIDAADELFGIVSANKGFVVFTGNTPLDTAEHLAMKAAALGISVLFDPGGADSIPKLKPLLSKGIFLIKPNEQEAEELTRVKVVDFETARIAAEQLRNFGAQNVLITHGANGAYLFAGSIQKHIPAPKLLNDGTKDETGCGDQVLAALCACMVEGKSLVEAAEIATLAGTAQFYRRGIRPLKREELDALTQSSAA